MTIDRRHATRLILTGSLAAPALIRPSSAFANNDGYDDEDDSGDLIENAFARIALKGLGFRNLSPASLILLTTVAVWGLSLAGQHRQYNENRMRVGGLLGSLTRPTVETRMRTASFLAPIVLLGNALFAAPAKTPEQLQLKVIVFNQLVSWELERKLRKVNVTGMPSMSQIRDARQVGELFLARGVLLALIYPVLGRSDWRAAAPA